MSTIHSLLHIWLREIKGKRAKTCLCFNKLCFCKVVDDELDMTQVVSAEPETPTLVVSSRQQTRTARSSVQPVDSLQATQVRRSCFTTLSPFLEQP